MAELMPQLRLKPLVIEPEANGPLDLRDGARLVEQARPVMDERDVGAVTHERRRGCPGRWVADEAASVEPAVWAGVHERELRVAEHVGERVAKGARPWRAPELDHQPRQPRAPPARGQPQKADADGHREQCCGLSGPDRLLERVVA